MQVLEGRYGPYVTDGTTNASMPKGADPDALTLEQARELLIEARRAAPPTRRTRPRRAAAAGASARRARAAPDVRAGRAKASAATATPSRRRAPSRQTHH